MEDAFIGTIIMFAGNFAPSGWLFCNGQTLLVSQYNSLYSILGTSYGGNGSTTFNLPNLNGRFPLGVDQSHSLGSTGGHKTVTLSASNLPAHTHSLNVSTQNANSSTPSGTSMIGTPGAVDGSSGQFYPDQLYAPASGSTALNPASIGLAGQGSPVSIMPSYQAINFIICVNGTYPVKP